ncbi:biosynthetic-type acetolactate synthase large subunit [soil metagenome]
MTKWNYQIVDADEIPAVFAKAFYLASHGRPGPVLLEITKDAQLAYLRHAAGKFTKHQDLSSQYMLDPKQIQEAASLLNQANKPYLLIGHGVLIANAEQVLLLFAEKFGAPVACTLLGLSAYPMDHPLYVGMLGMHGNYAANKLTNEADVILAIGMRFDDRVTGNLSTYAKQAKVIHIDIDPAEINKNVHADVALIGDAKMALQQLLPHVHTKNNQQWNDNSKGYYTQEYFQVIEKELAATTKNIKMAEVIHQLSEKSNGQAVLVTDVGQHQMIAARYYKFKNNNSHITSGGLGTMGFALPAAIGAKLAAMHREVIVVVGDGGFQMNIQELAVISQEKLAIKIILLNNNFLGMVRQWQELFFAKRYSFTELKNPDFVMIAQGYGIAAKRVVNRCELAMALDDLLSTPTACLLEVVVEKQENVFPMMTVGSSVSDMRLS